MMQLFLGNSQAYKQGQSPHHFEKMNLDGIFPWLVISVISPEKLTLSLT